jgi:hypothetical protein
MRVSISTGLKAYLLILIIFELLVLHRLRSEPLHVVVNFVKAPKSASFASLFTCFTHFLIASRVVPLLARPLCPSAWFSCALLHVVEAAWLVPFAFREGALPPSLAAFDAAKHGGAAFICTMVLLNAYFFTCVLAVAMCGSQRDLLAEEARAAAAVEAAGGAPARKAPAPGAPPSLPQHLAAAPAPPAPAPAPSAGCGASAPAADARPAGSEFLHAHTGHGGAPTTLYREEPAAPPPAAATAARARTPPPPAAAAKPEGAKSPPRGRISSSSSTTSSHEDKKGNFLHAHTGFGGGDLKKVPHHGER